MACSLCLLQVHAVHQAQQVGHIIFADDDVRLPLGLYNSLDEVTAALWIDEIVVASSKAADIFDYLIDEALSVRDRLPVTELAPIVDIHCLLRLEVDEVVDVTRRFDCQFTIPLLGAMWWPMGRSSRA